MSAEENKLSEQDKSLIDAVMKEAAEDAALVKKIIAEAKTVGVKQALMNNASAIIAEVKDDIPVVKDAIPAIKTGYKTTEFWAIAGVGIANIVALIIGKPIPIDVNLTIGSLVGIYTVIRGIVKK